MNPKIFLLSTLLIMAATEAKDDARGLKSIRPFCDGKGRLDDFRDVVQDLYLQRSGRSATVSYFLKYNSLKRS